MTVKLLTEHHLEFLSLKGGCTGSSESTLVKMPHCWKSHVMAQKLKSILHLAPISIHKVMFQTGTSQTLNKMFKRKLKHLKIIV